MADHVLRLPQVQARTGLARSTIYAAAKQGTFPKPFKIGLRAVAWSESEIDDWQSEQMSKRG